MCKCIKLDRGGKRDGKQQENQLTIKLGKTNTCFSLFPDR